MTVHKLNDKCALCGRERGQHKAKTYNCPFGKRDRIGGYSFSTTDVFTPKVPKKKE